MSDQSIEVAPREIRALHPRGDIEGLRAAYLELLKLSLCDLAGAGTRTVSWSGDRRVFSRELTGTDQLQWRAAGRDWPLNALTMTGLLRLDDLQACVEAVIADQVPGDLVEAGAWRGGSSILMRATLDALGAADRTVWVADSFQGFPVPESDGDQADVELEADMEGLDYLAPSLEQVQGHFERFGCREGVRFVPGFFEDTMSSLGAERWSVIRLDGDTYKATRVTLEALYPNLEVGGFVILDDYHFLDGCRRAVDDFRAAHGISEPIERIDYNAGRWRRADPTPISLAAADRHAAGAIAPARSRQAFTGSAVTLPTDRELQLSDELSALRTELACAEGQLQALRDTPWARARRWALGRARPG